METPGIGNNKFNIKLDEKWYHNEQVLHDIIKELTYHVYYIPIIVWTGKGGMKLFKHANKKNDTHYHIKRMRWKIRH